MKRLSTYGLFLFYFSEALAVGTRNYTIESGDTLKQISDRFYVESIGVSQFEFYSQVLELNPEIKNPNLIYAGESLVIPKGEGYVVQSGDTLLDIVKKNRSSAPHLSLDEHFNAVVSTNSIKDINYITIGQVLKLTPNESSSFKSFVEYNVRSGDTVYKVLDRFYLGVNRSELISVIKSLNPKIADLNKVEVGDTLNLPTRKDAQKLSKSKVSSREIASVSYKAFDFDKEVSKQIGSLSSVQANHYTRLFKGILKTTDKRQLIGKLKTTLEVARVLEHEQIEDSFLKLITSTIQSKDNENYLKDLDNFFKIWKEARSQKI